MNSRKITTFASEPSIVHTMKKILIALALCATAISANAQTLPENTVSTATIRVSADMTLSSTSIFGFNNYLTANLDLGQKEPRRRVGDDGKAIKFNSTIAALNYMGERGWLLE